MRTQPVHSIGGLRLRWRCGSPDNGWTRPTQSARWVALVASIKYFGTTWRRFSSGPRSANCHITYMTRKSGRHTRAMASECTHPRRRLSTQQSWRLPSRCQPVGGQFKRAWLRCRCRECQHFSQWGAGSIGLTCGLTEALRAGRPGLPVRKLATDVMIENYSVPAAASTIAFPLPSGDPLGRRATTARLVNGLPGISSTSGHQDLPSLGCVARVGRTDVGL